MVLTGTDTSYLLSCGDSSICDGLRRRINSTAAVHRGLHGARSVLSIAEFVDCKRLVVCNRFERCDDKMIEAYGLGDVVKGKCANGEDSHQ